MIQIINHVNQDNKVSKIQLTDEKKMTSVLFNKTLEGNNLN